MVFIRGKQFEGATGFSQRSTDKNQGDDYGHPVVLRVIQFKRSASTHTYSVFEEINAPGYTEVICHCRMVSVWIVLRRTPIDIQNS